MLSFLIEYIYSFDGHGDSGSVLRIRHDVNDNVGRDASLLLVMFCCGADVSGLTMLKHSSKASPRPQGCITRAWTSSRRRLCCVGGSHEDHEHGGARGHPKGLFVCIREYATMGRAVDPRLKGTSVHTTCRAICGP